MWDEYGLTRCGGPAWDFLLRAYYERRVRESSGWLRWHYQSILETLAPGECGC